MIDATPHQNQRINQKESNSDYGLTHVSLFDQVSIRGNYSKRRHNVRFSRSSIVVSFLAITAANGTSQRYTPPLTNVSLTNFGKEASQVAAALLDTYRMENYDGPPNNVITAPTDRKDSWWVSTPWWFRQVVEIGLLAPGVLDTAQGSSFNYLQYEGMIIAARDSFNEKRRTLAAQLSSINSRDALWEQVFPWIKQLPDHREDFVADLIFIEQIRQLEPARYAFDQMISWRYLRAFVAFCQKWCLAVPEAITRLTEPYLVADAQSAQMNMRAPREQPPLPQETTIVNDLTEEEDLIEEDVRRIIEEDRPPQELGRPPVIRDDPLFPSVAQVPDDEPWVYAPQIPDGVVPDDVISDENPPFPPAGTGFDDLLARLADADHTLARSPVEAPPPIQKRKKKKRTKDETQFPSNQQQSFAPIDKLTAVRKLIKKPTQLLGEDPAPQPPPKRPLFEPSDEDDGAIQAPTQETKKKRGGKKVVLMDF
jgi:hypothetical protein